MISAEPIELTEDNVKRLFASCMDRTKHPTNAVNLYSFRNSSRSPAIMYLENSKTEDLSKQIEYLFG